MGLVLEAWCYTRAGGPGVVLTAATRFQGTPELCSSVQIPQMKRWRDLYQKLQGALIPARLHHLYQGSVGDGRRWSTGIQGSHVVIDFFVYTSSIISSLFILLLCLLIVYTRWVILITPMPLRRWALGRPIHSSRAVMAAFSAGLPGSAFLGWGRLRLAGALNLNYGRR